MVRPTKPRAPVTTAFTRATVRYTSTSPSTVRVPRERVVPCAAPRRRARVAVASSLSTVRNASASASASSGSTRSAASPTHLGEGAGVGRHHRDAGGHGLERREAEPLVARRVGERPRRRASRSRAVGGRHVPERVHAVAVAGGGERGVERRRCPSRRCPRPRAARSGSSAASASNARTSTGRFLRGSMVPEREHVPVGARVRATVGRVTARRPGAHPGTHARPARSGTGNVADHFVARRSRWWRGSRRRVERAPEQPG